MEQPAGLIPRMTKLGNVYNAMRAYRRCDKNLSEVKERYGKQAWQSVIDILKETRGNH